MRPTNRVAVLVFLITGYALIFAQARVNFFRDWTGAQVDLLPGLMVYAAMAFRFHIVMLCAVIFGLLFDSLSLNMLGTTVVTLTVVGAACAKYREQILSDQFTTHWVLGLAASAAAPVLTVLVLRIGGMKPLVGAGSAWDWAIMTAGGGVITPVWFKIFNRLDDALRYKEMPESMFRQDRQIARGKH